MEEAKHPVRRPGGRSARVRGAVHQAVAELVIERGYGGFSVGEVAARAGVADTSIYRRWGSLEALVTDVAITKLTAQSPLPDTGSLRGDLRAYAAGVAHDITGPDGLAVLRLTVAMSARGDEGLQARDDFLAARASQLQTMLDRARDRGEEPPGVFDVVDHLVAPLYIRVLFRAIPLDSAYIDALVDYVLLRRSEQEDLARPHEIG
jgi:AcrR family transcriptional regulator